MLVSFVMVDQLIGKGMYVKRGKPNIMVLFFNKTSSHCALMSRNVKTQQSMSLLKLDRDDEQKVDLGELLHHIYVLSGNDTKYCWPCLKPVFIDLLAFISTVALVKREMNTM